MRAPDCALKLRYSHFSSHAGGDIFSSSSTVRPALSSKEAATLMADQSDCTDSGGRNGRFVDGVGVGPAGIILANQRSMTSGSRATSMSGSSSRQLSSCHVCKPCTEGHSNSTVRPRMADQINSRCELDRRPASCGCTCHSVEHERIRQRWQRKAVRRSRKHKSPCSVTAIVGASAVVVAAIGLCAVVTTSERPPGIMDIFRQKILERIRRNQISMDISEPLFRFPKSGNGLPGQQPSPGSETVRNDNDLHRREQEDVGTTALYARGGHEQRTSINGRSGLLVADLSDLNGDELGGSISQGDSTATRGETTSSTARNGSKPFRIRRRSLKSSKSSKGSHTKSYAKKSTNKYRHSKQSKGSSSDGSSSSSRSDGQSRKGYSDQRRRTRHSESSDSESTRSSRSEDGNWRTTLDKLRARADETEGTDEKAAASTEEENFYQFFLMDEDSLSSMPTYSPTSEPTPTYSPTVEPTTEPSDSNTEPPTFTPLPTLVTPLPTSVTDEPTFSMQPTTSTPEPTTLSPTFDPTLDPTGSPTFEPTFDPTTDPTVNPDFQCTRVLDGDNGLVRLSWDFPFEDDIGRTLLRLRMKYAGIGWLGWGVPESEGGGMVGSDAVIGLPNLPNSRTNPGRYELNGRSLSQIDLMPNRRQTLVDASIEQTETSTTMTFTYILNERERDNPFDVEEQTIIWAYGFSNTLGYHRDRGRSTIVFTECPPTAAPTQIETLEPTQEPTPDFTIEPTPLPTPSSFDCERIVDDNGFMKFSWNEPFQVAGRTLLTSRITFAGIGWVGWGIPTSTAGQMIGSDAVIGLPDLPNSRTNPGKYSLNAKGLAGVVLDPIVEQDLLDSSIVQTDEDTTMIFTYILNQPGSNPVNVDGGMNTFIWAYGFSNTLGYHRNRGSFETDFSCPPTQAPTIGPDTIEPTMEPSPAPQSTTQLPTQTFEYEVTVDQNDLVQYAWNTPFEVAGRTLLTSRLTYAGVGWLGWGVPDSPEGNMIGSTAVIGKPNEPEGRFNPGKYKLEGRFLGGIVPFPLIQQTLIEATIEQSADRTAMTWTMILNQTDFNPINENNQTLIWAYGFDNTFGLHRDRGSFVVNLMMSTQAPSAGPSGMPSSSPSASTMPSTINRPSASPTLSSVPSSAPTLSEHPSGVPSDLPSVSQQPSISLVPTTSASPSTSHKPSISLAPTLFAYPSVSPAPSTSAMPSSVPSDVPSVSSAPSSQPSQQPTTSNPPSVSFVPTISLKPSISHSPSISSRPSESSERPSAAPSISLQPSSGPSSHPSVSLEPSGLPSTLPSISLEPSTLPSARPSASLEPSAVPSQTPSLSLSPSSNPSVLPSISVVPTAFQGPPSTSPSTAPSNEPSVLPSAQPSLLPSSQPSILPSISPSSSPSLEPSGMPSATPTDKAPSSEPSAVPSDKPSTEPSSSPSGKSSTEPSGDPSSTPSLSPSSTPSTTPSADPSSPPTT